MGRFEFFIPRVPGETPEDVADRLLGEPPHWATKVSHDVSQTCHQSDRNEPGSPVTSRDEP